MKITPHFIMVPPITIPIQNATVRLRCYCRFARWIATHQPAAAKLSSSKTH